MTSRSSAARPVARRPRPSPELIAKLRQGKDDLRREREALPLPEKIRQVMELQRLQHPLLVSRRTLEPWEHPWDIDP